MRIIDINGGHTKRGIDWEGVTLDALRPDGVYVKLTEGSTYTSPWATIGAGGAASVDLPVGFYHFARPDTGRTDAGDAAKEARHFLREIEGTNVPVSLPLVLDVERAKRWDGLTDWIHHWLEAVNYPAVDVILYASPSFLLHICPIQIGVWVAHYGVREPAVPDGWSWRLHQYSSHYHCDGLKKRVDVSRSRAGTI